MLEVRLQQHAPISLDVTLSCRRGELLALVGPSGSGKTTVLRSIAGLNRVDAGYIRCEGHDWLDSERRLNLSPQQRRVGMVFQNYALFPHLTVADNLALAMPRYVVDRASEIAELLDKVHLPGMGERLPAQLSGGQKQRVALARALARKPDVLLLDEPFSAVDKVTRRKLYLELQGLRRQLNMPVILVTHDLDEAAMLADSICVLHQGKTLQQGSPEHVLYHPADVGVARQVDARNLFEGELRIEDGRPRLHWHQHALDVDAQAGLPPGPVHWTIAPDKVLLHQRRRPSRGELENPLMTVVLEQLRLRGLCTLLLRVEGAEGALLQMDIPEHALLRNRIRIGDRIGVSLLASAIHLMPGTG